MKRFFIKLLITMKDDNVLAEITSTVSITAIILVSPLPQCLAYDRSSTNICLIEVNYDVQSDAM